MQGVDKNLVLWNIPDRKKILLMREDLYKINQIAISSDNRYMVIASDNKRMYLWAFLEEKTKAYLCGHQDDIYSMDFTSGGNLQTRFIASTGRDMHVNVWRYGEEEDVMCSRFKAHDNAINQVSFSKDATKLVTTSLDKDIKVFNIEGELLKTIKGKGRWEYTNSAIFNHDGKEILAATDNVIRVFEEESGMESFILEGHTKTVLCL